MKKGDINKQERKRMREWKKRVKREKRGEERKKEEGADGGRSDSPSSLCVIYSVPQRRNFINLCF